MPPHPPPPPVTAESLERAALHYLDRYAATAAALRRVLMNRVRRSAALHGEAPGENIAHVEALVARFVASGLIRDDTFAATRAASLRRRGASRAAVAGHLRARGVSAELLPAALEAAEEDFPGGDESAAWRLARRRRLGPFREESQRAASRLKDLAILGRAGFDGGTARKVIDADAVPEMFL